jgi:hypothetical protein
LMTREMVLTEQPLRRAMSLMVMFGIPGSTSLSVEVLVFTEIVRERCRERFQ